MTPMNKFIKKKFPIIITKTKNSAAPGDVIPDLEGVRSRPLIFEALYITSLH